jgi:DAK2 domain fusion protein YloV
VLEVLDADAVRRWYRSGLRALEASRAEIDSLNVFPVADADTGTNLFLTLQSAAAAADADDQAAAGAEPADTATTMTDIARLCLLGARGSSGVILSQLLRGIAEGLATQRRPPRGLALTAGLERAVTLAYAAVAQPVEGTMLTVARAAAEGARRTDSDRLDLVVAAAALAAHDALRRTPSQLEVLRRAGVVDAGGRGIVVLLDVLQSVIDEREIILPAPRIASPRLEPCADSGPLSPAYEVMYLIDTADDRVPALRAALDEIGEAVVVSGGDGLWNVHVHTDDASAAVELAVAAGRPRDIRVTQINEQINKQRAHPVDERVVVIVLSPGSEVLVLRDLLTRSGAHVIEESDGTSLGAELGAAEVVVLVEDVGGLPDRVRPAASTVIPVEAGVQFLSAVAVHDPHRAPADDVAAMSAAVSATRTATVGPADADRLCVDAVAHLERLLADGGDLVTVVSAADIGARIAGVLADTRPDVDVNQLTVDALGSMVLLGVE